MSTGFDPYHRWLSIPPPEQPANHYRLLGLQPFETDTEVIHSAAKRQISHVRRFLDSPLSPHAQNVISELGVAQKCLLDRDAKLAYDAWLAQRIDSKASQPAPHLNSQHVPSWEPTPTPPTAFEVASFNVPNHVPARRSLRRRSPSAAARIFQLVLWLAGAVVGLLAGYAILCMMDPQYDFLHVMFADNSVAPNSSVAEASPILPPAQQKQSREPKFNKPIQRPKPRAPRNDEAPKPAVPSPPPTSGTIPRDPPSRPNSVVLFHVPEILALPMATRSGEFVGLTSIPCEPNDIQLFLIQGSSRKAGRLAFSEPKEKDAKLTWAVRWIPYSADLRQINDIDPSDVATFEFGNEELRFTWAAGVRPVAKTALRNSLLSVRLRQDEYVAALRQPVILSPLDVNLRRRFSNVICKCEDLPELQSICLHLTDLSALPPHRFEGQQREMLKLDESIVVQYVEAPGMYSRMSFTERSSRPTLMFESGYRLPSGREEVITTQNLRRCRDELEQEFDVAKSYEETSQSKRKDFAVVRARVEADLDALALVEAVALQLHELTEVPYRFFFTVGDREVDLVVCQP